MISNIMRSNGKFSCRHCREIDRVRRREDLRIGTVHGHRVETMGLYTYDVDLDVNWENVDHRRRMRQLRQQGMIRRNSRRVSYDLMR